MSIATTVVLFVWTVMVAATARFTIGPGSTVRALWLLVKASPLVVLLSLWWLVPFVHTLQSGSTGVELAAERNVADWAWSHADNTLANVVTLRAHWGWDFPEIFPYASSLDEGIWPWLRWILPLGALLAVVIVRRRRLVLTLFGFATVAVFIAKGLHEPFGGLNRWLYEQVWVFGSCENQ